MTVQTAPAPARAADGTALARVGGALTPAEWGRAGALAAAIIGLHVLGWLTLLLAVVPRHFHVSHTQVYGAGLGVTAYTLGLRHAFDADHIAAIDNTTRKLMADGKRPLSVGFFFSIGHSTVVFVLCLLLTVGLRISGAVQAQGSTLHQVTGLVGTLVSGSFLYLIGIINLVILVGILRVFRDLRRGHYDEQQLEQQLANRGLLNRLLGRVTRSVRSSGQMYPVGVLFGLGFDTATEVALLVIAAGAVGSGLPWYAILCLPVLFAAGMSLLDTIDGTFMNFAYGWAFSQPVRKVYYNLTVTGLAIAVALLIGTVELAQVAQSQLHLHGAFWSWVAGVSLNSVGYLLVVLFVGTWVLALAVWRFAGIERRWSAQLRPATDED